MSPALRAFLGAMIGAALTLMLHPVSRPFVTNAFLRVPPPSLRASLDTESASLSAPRTLLQASLWVEIAAMRVRGKQPLQKRERQTLLALCREASRRQPDNAFWFQFQSVLLHAAGDESGAKEAWLRGSRCRAWNDFQTERLVEARANLASRYGADQAWQYAFVYFARSEDAAALIKAYAQTLLQHTDLSTVNGLRWRYYTARNGSLLRDGARSLRVGVLGSNIVELATYPKSLTGTPSPKRIWIAKTQLTAALREHGMVEESERAEQCFRSNDGWLFLTQVQNPEERVRNLSLEALVTDVVPSIFAVCGVVGAICYAAGRLSQPRAARMRVFHPVGVGLAALASAGALFFATHSPVAAAAAGLGVAFLIMGPFLPRTRKSADLGPLYGFVLLCIAFGWIVAFGGYLLGHSTPSVLLVASLGPIGEPLADPAAYLGVACVVASLLCLAAPSWAVVHRFGTPDLFALTVTRFGAIVGITGLLGVVISGPLAVYTDRLCTAELSPILRNEPLYYFLQ